jgi:hypothetical protein
MRKRISRHIESCDTCEQERRRLVSPAALLGAAPVFVPAPTWLRDQTLAEVQLTSASAPMHVVPGDAGTGSTERQGSWTLPVTAFAVALIAAASAALLWVNVPTPAIPTPIPVSDTAPVTPSPASRLPEPPAATGQSKPPADAPTRHAPPAEQRSAGPEPEAAQAIPEPTPAPPPPPPPVVLPPPPPPPVWPDLAQWPQWPPLPGIDPGGPGSQITGPSGIANPEPDPILPG